MAQDKDISSKTQTGVNPLTGALQINVSYNEQQILVGTEIENIKDPKISQVEILENPSIKNSTKGLEGELLINNEKDIESFIDTNGDFYISNANANDYEINEQGELIFKHII